MNKGDADGAVLALLPRDIQARAVDLRSIGVGEIAFPIANVRAACEVALTIGLLVFGGDLWGDLANEWPKPVGINWDAPVHDGYEATVLSLQQFLDQSWIEETWYLSLVWSARAGAAEWQV